MAGISDIVEGSMVEGTVSEVASVVEEWRKIKDYPNYEVSSLGRVRSGRKIFTGWKAGEYVKISLTKNKVSKSFRLHRIVAETFIPNPENKLQVNHLQGNKTDNRVCMLEWATHTENCQHSSDYIKVYKPISVSKIDVKTNQIIKTYEDMRDVAKDNYELQYVQRCYRGERNTYKGFIWKQNKVNDIIEEYNDEIWKHLKNSIFNEVNIYINYFVSNYGRVKNIKGQYLKLSNNENYLGISLSVNGTNKTFKIHRLMLMAFNIKKPNGKNEVDHIDSNSLNNKLSNLRWANRTDQINNEATKLKRNNISQDSRYILIDVTFNNITKNYKGITKLSKTIKIDLKTILKYAKSGIKYKGYTFKITNNK
jgi:hypothetical protein